MTTNYSKLRDGKTRYEWRLMYVLFVVASDIYMEIYVYISNNILEWN